MALKNLFDMAKADKYTADGREEIIKAQEAETEDKVYQIGEISQKTGLQKTANGWVKPKNGKQPGAASKHDTDPQTYIVKKNDELRKMYLNEKDPAKKEAMKKALKKQASMMEPEPFSSTGSKKIDYQVTEKGGKFYATGHQFSDGSQLHAGPFGSEKELHEFMNGSPYKSTAESKPAAENKTTIRQGPNTKTLNETPAEHVQKNLDAYKGYSPYDMEELVLKPSGYEKQTNARVPGGGQSITYTKNGAEDITLFFDKNGELENADVAGSKPAAPRREAVSAGRMMKDLDGNFWSRPEDFKEDITSRGWDVDEMTNEYAVISNEAGSQYEVRFDDHSDEGDLTVRNFKALQIDEDDDDDSLEDAAPSLSEIVDRVYNIGEISEKTGLQKTANGWRPVKKGAAGKTSRANKEEAIRKDLGLTAGEDMSRFSDEQIEKMYAKTQQTPEQQKADFDKSKIGQAVNKGRQEFAAEKTRQKELASKTNAIGLPKESKPALSQTDGKGNKVEIKITESKGGGFYVDKYVNGKKVGINNANTRESAEAKAKSMMEQHMADPDYKAESKPANKPKVPSSDDLDWAKGVASRNNVKAEDLIKNGTALKPGIKVSFNTPRDGDLSGEIIDIAGYDGKAFVTVSTPKENRTIATEKVVTDSAPRVLTGDCRIRIRKEKPALTGDTKIRVRK